MSRLFVFLFLAAFSAFGEASPQFENRLQREALALEQVCYIRGFRGQAEFVLAQINRFSFLLGALEPELKAHRIEDEEVPKDWDFKSESWKGGKTWLDALRVLPATERCERLGVAYTFAVIQLSILEPTTPIEGFRDILLKEVTPEIVQDRRRAAWQLRYVKFVPAEDFPFRCQELAKETELRWKTIFTDRKPLGYALGMCGRPMNAHYLDDEVTAHKRNEPAGWKGVLPRMWLRGN